MLRIKTILVGDKRDSPAGESTLQDVVDAIRYRLEVNSKYKKIIVYYDGDQFTIRNTIAQSKHKYDCLDPRYLVGVYRKGALKNWIAEDILNAYRECTYDAIHNR